MRVVVCVRPASDGQIGPFEASAYEAALRIPDAEVVLLSMAQEKCGEELLRLTRLGAKEAYHLCDRAFAGADTLATTYALSRALIKLAPDLVICGRQTMEGDTAQVGLGLAARMGYGLVTQVMAIERVDEKGIACRTRSGETKQASFPALITVERIHTLRLPSIRSRVGSVIRWSAADIGADVSRCGQKGSPTRVLGSFKNQSDKRRCHFVAPAELESLIATCRKQEKRTEAVTSESENKLPNVWIVGEAPCEMAMRISRSVTVVERDTPESIAARIRAEKPSAVLWDSSPWAKETAATVAVLLETGLCADCTVLETDGEHLFMYRPAFAGNIIAKIACDTAPAMATVRIGEENSAEVMFALGKGAAAYRDELATFADRYGAELVASRAAVDAELMPYECQVGLTGRTVSPRVYVTFGVSGAVHHIAGMKGAGTVIAIDRDKKASIFDYADYGIVCELGEIFGTNEKGNLSIVL